MGVTDYGIYNVVGGVITILGFVTGSLGGATSRYITTALGKGDKHALLKLFSSILFIHYFAGAIIFVLSETVGLWFVL
ncbi:MAG: lipopolysaccharide biosynthesis protein, partial [Bacteroidales bacterium]|nr:lipopolysaccharide biosynthesis protein [Bacteroidales bacterium]